MELANGVGRRGAVFLDRDGVINENRPDHVKSWAEFVFLPDVFGPLRTLSRDDRAIVVISNQAVIGRGLASQEDVDQIHRRMCAEIVRHGGRIDAVYYCPHRPEEGCHCRKPRPGLLLRAAGEMRLDLAGSYLIGDALGDVEAALAVGCSPVLVLTGRGHEQLPLLRECGYSQVPVASNLAQAVNWILARGTRGLLGT